MSSLFGSLKQKVKRRSSVASSKSASKNPFAGPNHATPTPKINMGEAPPAYTADAPSGHTAGGLSPVPPIRGASPTPSTGSAISMASVTNDNDKYAFLRTFDTVFVVDDSGSMSGRNWHEAREVLAQVTQICTKRDKDGIDLYFLNNYSKNKGGRGKGDGGYYNITDPRTVNGIFNDVQPTGLTPTGKRLRQILKPYTDMLSKASDVDSVKPVNIIVITDGYPSDDPESIIVQEARKLDRLDAPPYQMGIQFFQVGNSGEAREALRRLDDELEDQGVRDMVDTATWDDPNGVLTVDGILKVVLGAVVRRIDRQRTCGEQRRR